MKTPSFLRNAIVNTLQHIRDTVKKYLVDLYYLNVQKYLRSEIPELVKASAIPNTHLHKSIANELLDQMYKYAKVL